ncbi:MAG: DEAD/DEAH box helicase [Sulfurimonas sp.]
MSEQGKIKLRDYQLDIIKQTLNSDKSTLIQVPTGGGKTLIAKEIIVDLVGRLNLQVLFVAPQIILMEQTEKVFKSLNPHVVHGIKKYDKNHKVLVSTIQTAGRRDINPDVIIIDEIHYGFKGKMIERLIKDKPNTRVIGLSATPYDKDGEQLKGFDLVLDKYDTKYMVENKHLVNLEWLKLTKIMKLDTVKITAGDYNQQALSKIVCNNQTILEIVGSTAEYIQNYKKAIVFAVDINHAELLTKAYQHDGFAAKVIHSNLNQQEQEIEFRRFKDGQTKILVSVAMLTTGFDMPDADVAIIARPTKSQNLYKQMVGRVLRLAPNKTHAILLDCGNVIDELGEPLDPIKAMQTKEIADNQQKCEGCQSNNLKLKRKDEKLFWECEDCGRKKDIEHGTYKCKLCGKSYTHNAKFSQKNNKLWLDCDICPHPTLISEYTGSEQFVKITDNKYEETNNKKSLVKILEEENKIKKVKENEDITAIAEDMSEIKKYNFEKLEYNSEEYSQAIFEEIMRIVKVNNNTIIGNDNASYSGLSHKYMKVSILLTEVNETKIDSAIQKQISTILRVLHQNPIINFGLFIKNYKDIEEFSTHCNYFKTDFLTSPEAFTKQKNIIINVLDFIEAYKDEEKRKNIDKNLRSELGRKSFSEDPQKTSLFVIIKDRPLTKDELFEFYGIKGSIIEKANLHA